MSEIRQAFEHPEVRASATAAEAPHDRISLRDHVVEVEIGAFQAERGVRQRVVFNVVVELTPVSGPIDDDVDRILSYDRLTEAIQIELAAERLNLLETLAERIALRILSEPRAFRVFVRIEKLDRGPGALGVEIVRSSDPATDHPISAQSVTPVPHPVIVHLSPEALSHPNLTAWIDAMDADPRPVIVTVGLPLSERPQSEAKPAQRRIDLLAIEQNAWTLAGRDPRCVVRASRTELDWAARQGHISVWAPSKMVLDAVHGPKGEVGDLVVWLAQEMSAVALLTLGDTPIDGAHALDLAGPCQLPAASK
ncbi:MULTISPECIES: dihydroneopterin aldolase [Roseobacteraceae]|uniref:Dihydroneopterin aldolase-like protein n=1 Tax=Celeribacter baekdonensis B30 TaxID=1208323 RepID=K2ISX6_9RHOB|nr:MULTISPECIES: dihydroneopterin aldolase [Roseobacteraceae]EKE73366.1 dihydroneopterin aldolase-like protein [Celeribacter baekdonensis B30]KAB6717453.1 dihydroneopterin aldolase [Roseobacter sp. TSBP12]